MRATIEHLSGIVRVGPQTKRYGDPYQYAVAFSSTDGKTAIIKALTSNGGLKLAHARAAIKALKKIGLAADWERIV